MSISAMKKLTVVTPKDEMQAVVRKLIKLRCVEVRQIDRGTCDGLWMKNSYDAQKSALETFITDINNAMSVLNVYSSRVMGLGDG